MRYIAGIDPGLTGALAILDFEDFKIHIFDTPTITVMVGDKKRQRCDVDAFANAMEMFPIDAGLIENVQSLPSDGHVGAFTFGKVTGIAIGIAAGLGIPLGSVSPAKWKLRMQCSADKKATVHRASALFPQCTGAWTREKDHGRAEACLIALYYAIEVGQLPTQPFTIGLINGEPYSPKKAKAT